MSCHDKRGAYTIVTWLHDLAINAARITVIDGGEYPATVLHDAGSGLSVNVLT